MRPKRSPFTGRRTLSAAAALVLTGTALTAAGAAVAAPSEAEAPEAFELNEQFSEAEFADELDADETSAGPDVLPGEVASENMELVTNIPMDGELQGTGSDLAFEGDYAYAGNYDGFTIYELSDDGVPNKITEVVCPGAQNDVSVYGDILIASVDARMTDNSCNAERTNDPENYWEGIRVFDVSAPTNPQYLQAVETKCGSHTHSLAPTKNGKDLYVYVSSYSPNDALANCKTPHDLISVVKVPVDDPASAAVVSEPVLFPEGGHDGTGHSGVTSGCHDITTYAKKDLAAGACMGDGVLMDISDRANPVAIDTVRDTENFAFWHSATFNNDATKVIFTDELGGGGWGTCTEEFGPELGANGIYTIEDDEMEFASYYKIPRINTENENCVAHNGSLIPVKGRDIMVQSWYQGGTSVFDFTGPYNPEEIAWFDRGEGLSDGGTWSSYYYNGYVYSNDLDLGLDVFKLDPSIDGKAKKLKSLNPQMQEKF
ncbi:LVIVD repeat-containing protein [Brevibacterium litoralis]|uniref:LVIVD repeat-containing protein n=1 Tax=Brevibacterium litoralis TaxID=3138935 RepID=UPI0032ECA401